MENANVGASILNIITESLYDKPIAVFREYVQNSVDSLGKVTNVDNREILSSQIWTDNNNLYFLDNGTGINSERFLQTMQSIAFSHKERTTNIGYKGIGRLSGISYCKKINFINILNFQENHFQKYTIDCVEYDRIRKNEKYNEMTFSSLMQKIGKLDNDIPVMEIVNSIEEHKYIFDSRNTGFLVILEDVSLLLDNVMKDEMFEEELSWLLPVPFPYELLSENEETCALFKELSNEPASVKNKVVAAQAYKIVFEGNQLFRPLNPVMFRTYLCKCHLADYAVCVQSFSNEKFEIDKKNSFSGIRVYIDNMLLCDENELIPVLKQYGFTSHGSYELIQSVRGVGVMIYIVDKVNISANARRTFIELTDQDSLTFLELIAKLVDNIYDARYALSKYAAALRKETIAENVVEEKKEKALYHLRLLASDEIKIEVKDKENQTDFEWLPKNEQKRIIKGKLTREINESIKTYLEQTEKYDLDTYFDDFKTWFLAN